MYHQATFKEAANGVESGGGKVLSSTEPRISDFVDNRIQGELGEQVDDGLETIQSVHKPIKSSAKLPIVGETKARQAGAFHYDPKTRAPQNIGIHPHSPNPEMTVAHEYGHNLHMTLFHSDLNTDGYTKLDSPELKGLKDALEDSDAVKTLRESLESKSTFDKVGDLTMPNELSPKDIADAEYYLEDQELFARSYAQYIATRSGNKTMLGQLDEMRSAIDFRRDRQWDGNDFAPIATAFDTLFSEKGLR